MTRPTWHQGRASPCRLFSHPRFCLLYRSIFALDLKVQFPGFWSLNGASFLCLGLVGVLSLVLQEVGAPPSHPTDPTNTTIVLKGIPLSARLQWTGTSVNYIDPALREDRRLNSSKRGLPERVGIAKQEPHPPAKWALCVNVNDRNWSMSSVFLNNDNSDIEWHLSLTVSSLVLANMRRSCGAPASCLCQLRPSLPWASKPFWRSFVEGRRLHTITDNCLPSEMY